MGMERLHSVLKGEAKKSVESTGKSGIFHATALKTLKRDFGNVFTVAYMKTKLLFQKPQLKHKHTRNIDNCEDLWSLEQFQIWLDNRVKEHYNPIANILASDEPYKIE